MKLYLDDIRNPNQTYPNDSDWFVVRNYNEFVSAIEKHFSDLEIISFDSIITHISFDHDLANFDSDGNEVTGYDCVKWLCDYIQDNNLDISNLRLNFHTANPVGKENMASYWNNFKDYYTKYLKEVK